MKKIILAVSIIILALSLFAIRLNADVLCKKKSACANLLENPLVSPNNTVVPILYEMLDHENKNWRLSHPTWKAVGAWYWLVWSRIQGSRNAKINRFDDYLENICGDSECTVEYNGKSSYKPVALSVYITNYGDDLTPSWVYSQGAQKYFIPGKTAGCKDIQVPAFGDPIWQRSYNEMVMQLGRQYKDNPLVDSIWIATGNYGETATTIRLGNCVYNLNHGGTFGNWITRGYYVNGSRKPIAALWRKAFGDKPLFMMITNGTGSKEQAEIACEYDVGFKTNTLHGNTPLAYTCQNGKYYGTIQIADHIKEKCSIGFEHAFLSSPSETYWAMMSALAHGADVIDLDSRAPNNGGIQFFDKLASVKMPSGEILWSFVQRYLGIGYGKGSKNPDSIWMLFRHSEKGKTCAENPWAAQEPGDWEFYLYRPENTCKDYPAGTCEPGTDMGNRFNEDIVGGISAYVPGSEVGGNDGIYGKYGARKTTKNGSFYFTIDSRFKGKLKNSFEVSITYWANGGTFALELFGLSGKLRRHVIRKGTGGWKNKKILIKWANLMNAGFRGNTNFALSANGDGDDIFHMVELTPVDLCKGVLCQPIDECHTAGVCNPMSGICSTPPKKNGAVCGTGVCADGACVVMQDSGVVVVKDSGVVMDASAAKDSGVVRDKGSDKDAFVKSDSGDLVFPDIDCDCSFGDKLENRIPFVFLFFLLALVIVRKKNKY